MIWLKMKKKTLKAIALELLEMYRCSETSLIWEYSGDIEGSIKILSEECDEYMKAIEDASNG